YILSLNFRKKIITTIKQVDFHPFVDRTLVKIFMQNFYGTSIIGPSD
ncbi:MAG: hypothetical protein ACI9JR_002880, partial [Gammaproteobacteria bacterium]